MAGVSHAPAHDYGSLPRDPACATQLRLPMALGGGREFVTMPGTQHFESHVEIIGKFLEQKVVTESRGELVHVKVGA